MTDGGHLGERPDLWDLESLDPRVEVLAAGPDIGWQADTTYSFQVDYQSDGLIDLRVEEADTSAVVWSTFTVDPLPLGSGRFGFYNFSQPKAAFGDATIAYPLPQVERLRAHGTQSDTIDTVEVSFNQPMTHDSFEPTDDIISVLGPSGSIDVTAYRWVDARTLALSFAVQPGDDWYELALGASIEGANGGFLDQDDDGTGGETPDDEFRADFSLDQTSPRIVATNPWAETRAPFSQLSVHFSEPLNRRTFTKEDVQQFIGPDGNDLKDQVRSVTVSGDQAIVYFDPQSKIGDYQITIGPQIEDWAGNSMDQNRDGSSGQSDDVYELTITVHSPDLWVQSIDDPQPGLFGSPITVNWVVANKGDDPAEGIWHDYVYLSSDEQWDLDDPLVGVFTYDSAKLGPVAADGGTYPGEITETVPGVLIGEYHVLVRTNLLGELAETDIDNNDDASQSAAHFDLPSLVPDTPLTGSVDYGQELYFRMDITPDQVGGSIVLKFGTSDTAAPSELYVGHESLPTRPEHDIRSEQGFASNQWLILSPIRPGTYYVLALAAPDQRQSGRIGNFNIQADLFVPGEFEVLDSHFGQGGTAGNRTIEINGINFDRTITVSLTDGGGPPVEAQSYFRVGPEKLYATFDLTQVAPGDYNVEFTSSARLSRDEPSHVVTNGLRVVDSNVQPKLDINISAPPAFRRVFHAPWVHFPATASWHNNTLNDVPLPILQFTSNEPFGTNLDDTLSGGGQYVDTFFAVGDGAPGVVLAGQGGSATYHVVPRGQRDVIGNEHVSYTLNSLYEDAQVPFDWSTVKAGLRSSYLNGEEFDATFEQFASTTGITVGDYVRVLKKSYELLESVPENAIEATYALLQEAFDRFAATVHTSIVGEIKYGGFDIAVEDLTVTAYNTNTQESFISDVRLDGLSVFPKVTSGEYELTVTGGAVATAPHPKVTVAGNTPATSNLPITWGGCGQGTNWIGIGRMARRCSRGPRILSAWHRLLCLVAAGWEF